jgi:oxalate---CoA ligase
MNQNLSVPGEADTDLSRITCVQPGGSSPPLFFVHGVAGNVERFGNLVRHLGPDEGIYVLQEQGLNDQHPILSNVEAMASAYIRAMRMVQPEGPYFMVGYSFGGLIAFEIAQQLQREGQKVPFIGLIDAGQPIYRKDYANVLLSPKMLASYLRRMKELLADPASRGTVWSRFRNEFVRLLLFKLPGRRVSSHKPDSRPVPRTPAILEAAKIEAAVNYKPQPFPGRLSVFRVEERITVDKFDRYLGWGGLADDGIDVYDVPGDHVTVCEEPYVRVLVENFKIAVQAARDKNK